MSVNEDIPGNDLLDMHVHAREAPLCYSRQTTSEAIEQARIDAQSSAVLMAFSVVTCGAAFLVAYRGWSF